MTVPPLPLLEMAASALGGGGLTSALTYLTSRKKADIEAMDVTVKSLAAQLDRTDVRLLAVELQHSKCETSLREVNQRLDETERERTALKAEIGRLMGGEIAPTYTEIQRHTPKKPRRG